MEKISSIEEFIFEFIDKCKLLFFPEKWNSTFLDYSKNEIFALLFVYRKGSTNMSEISQYLGIPLNTTTGVISRIEKRGVVKRERDPVDKRVVTVTITPEGNDFLANELKIVSHYYSRIMDSISEEEKLLLLKLISGFLDILSQKPPYQADSNTNKRVKRITIE